MIFKQSKVFFVEVVLSVKLTFIGEKIMSYAPFFEYFPEIAKDETRVITIMGKSSWKLPPAEYAFLEMFCNEPGCDCRRVMFTVMSSLDKERPKAVIAYGWEKKRFYVKWLRDTDPAMIRDLIGPVLNLGSPESDISQTLLKLFKDVLLKDKQYIERVKRHYFLVREKIDGPRPIKRKLN